MGLNKQENKIPNTECAICGTKFYRCLSKKKSKSGLYFCSRKCQNEAYRKHIVLPNGFSKLLSENETKSLSKQERYSLLRKRKRQSLKRTCKLCGKAIYNTNKSGYCADCIHKETDILYTPEKRKLFSETTKRNLKLGKIKPWQSRKLLSYPELFFKNVLEKNGIVYEGPNYPIRQVGIGVVDYSPQACYFLDFKIGKVDLEIDGKQHLYTKRANADIIRDNYLTNAGYIVYRIPWKSINSKKGKEYIKKEIEKLLIFLEEHNKDIL